MGALMLWWLAATDAEDPDRERETIAAQLQALEAPPLRAGADAELSLLILESPERGLPLEVRLRGGELALAEDRLDWSAVVDPLALQPRLRVGLRAPAAPGSYTVAASVDYSVCGEQWCRRKHGQVRWTVVVQ